MDPSTVLSEPVPDTVFPGTLDVFLGMSDFISPSFYIRKGIELVMGVDPIDYATRQIGGDWEAVSKAGSALTQMGQYVSQVSKEIDRARDDLAATWTGNAATNATSYFDSLARAVGNIQAQLDSMAHGFQTAATGIKSLGDAICDLVGVLLDYLIEIGIAACATGAFAWTGVGAAVGGAGTAYLCYKAASTWMKISEALGTANSIAKGAFGATMPLSTLNIDPKFVLPGGYKHPYA